MKALDGFETFLVVAFCIVVAFSGGATWGCSGAQTVEAATCSPKADVWHQVELARVCVGKLVPEECPESVELKKTYLELEAQECSQRP